MRKTLRTASPILAILAIAGCGDSLGHLNQLAAAGSIHEEAPVTAHLEIQIAASPAKVWGLLVDPPSWPKWQKQIEKVTAPGPIRSGTRFSWSTGGAAIHSQVQLFDPERRLSWTGTALTGQSDPRLGIEARIRRSDSANRERVYGGTLDCQDFSLGEARRSGPGVVAGSETGCGTAASAILHSTGNNGQQNRSCGLGARRHKRKRLDAALFPKPRNLSLFFPEWMVWP